MDSSVIAEDRFLRHKFAITSIYDIRHKIKVLIDFIPYESNFILS